MKRWVTILLCWTAGVAGASSTVSVTATLSDYQALLQRGWNGPDLLFNAGTLALSEGRLGESILYLERASKQQPYRADIEANLDVARQKQNDQIVGDTDLPFLQRLVSAVSRWDRSIEFGFLISWMIAFVGLGVLLLFPQNRKAWMTRACTAGFVAATGLGLFVILRWHLATTLDEEVVTSKAVKVRELPSAGSKVSFEVHEGLKVRVVDTRAPWIKLHLDNGLEGWIERGDAERI